MWEVEQRQENKTCRHCGWSGAPYHVVCPSCFTLAVETARQAKELETRLAEVERERDAAESVCTRLDDKLARALLERETLTAALEAYRASHKSCGVDGTLFAKACQRCRAAQAALDQARGGQPG